MNSGLARPGSEWTIRPARWPLALVSMLALVAIGATLLSGLPVWLRMGLVLAAIVYAGWQIHRLYAPRWRSVWVQQGEAVLRDRSDERFRVLVDHQSFVSPLYLGFDCRKESSARRASVGLFRGQVDDEGFRRLSVLLRERAGS